MQTIHELISNLNRGETQSLRNLTMVPLTGEWVSSIEYLTLDQALSGGTATVSEISDSGSVPDLKFTNDGEQSVFLLDGEELVGAKQNRVLNLSVLAPAMATITIPVSCVEQGRWSYNSDKFCAADRAQFSEGRARKAQMVSRSLNENRSARSDQSEIWRDVSRRSASFGVRSESGAMSDIFEAQKHKIDDFVDNIEPKPDQVGALFLIAGHVAGLDVFDKPSTSEKLLPKLVRSYALDALDESKQQSTSDAENATSEFLANVQSAALNPFPAVGIGNDYRFAGDEIAGGALLDDGQVIHLCAFPLKSEKSDNGQFKRSRMTRSSNRGNRYRNN